MECLGVEVDELPVSALVLGLFTDGFEGVHVVEVLRPQLPQLIHTHLLLKLLEVTLLKPGLLSVFLVGRLFELVKVLIPSLTQSRLLLQHLDILFKHFRDLRFGLLAHGVITRVVFAR